MRSSSSRFARFFLLLAGSLALPLQALADWGQNWGTMIWGQSAPVVPSLEGVGLGLLVMSLLGATAWRVRRRSAVASLLLVALAVPLTVGAIDVLVPNTFSNGSVAHADEVNANFTAAESGANTLLMESGSGATAVVPNQFVDGTVADATKVNENFTAIETAIETASTANAAAVAAATQAGCEGAGGTWNAGTSTCTAASNYNCFVGGFCSQAAIVYPPATFLYTNVYDGDTQGTEPALGAGCNVASVSFLWDVGVEYVSTVAPSIFVGPDSPRFICASN